MEDTKKQITAEFMSRKDLAAYASVSVRTVSSWIKLDMPHYRIGGLLRIKRSEFDEWMKRFRVEDQGKKLDAIVDEVLRDFGIPHRKRRSAKAAGQSRLCSSWKSFPEL